MDCHTPCATSQRYRGATQCLSKIFPVKKPTRQPRFCLVCVSFYRQQYEELPQKKRKKGCGFLLEEPTPSLYANEMMNIQKKRNIILTGFRATGKTTVGKALAQRLQWAFVDTDEQLSQRLGASIAEVVAHQGWAFFRQEEACLLRQLQTMRSTVLAVGGGTIVHQQEWQQLRNCGYVVWLDADITTIRRRLMMDPATAQQRPSVTGTAVQDEIDLLLTQRIPLYRAGADLRLAPENKHPEELASQIVRAFGMNRQPL